MSGLSQIADEIVAYLQPIADGLEFPDSLQNLLNHVGAVNGSDDALIAALTTIVDFGRQCETLASQNQPSFEAGASLLELSRQAVSALSALNDAGGAVAGVSSLGRRPGGTAGQHLVGHAASARSTALASCSP